MNELIDEVNAFINMTNHNSFKPRKFRVLSTEFDTFDEVESWAWNEFKLDASLLPTPTLEEQYEACDELSNMILHDADLFEEYNLFRQYGPRKKIVIEA